MTGEEIRDDPLIANLSGAEIWLDPVTYGDAQY
jgi:hypothetical protein